MEGKTPLENRMQDFFFNIRSENGEEVTLAGNAPTNNAKSNENSLDGQEESDIIQTLMEKGLSKRDISKIVSKLIVSLSKD